MRARIVLSTGARAEKLQLPSPEPPPPIFGGCWAHVGRTWPGGADPFPIMFGDLRGCQVSSAALCGSRPPLAAGRSYSCLSLWLALRSYAPETCERYEVPKSSAPSAWATMGRSRKGCLLEFSRHLRNAAASRQPPPTPYGAMRYGNDGAPESRLHTHNT